MTIEKKQTGVDIIYQGMSDKIVMQDLNKALICIHISHDDFLKLHKQAKEMEKEQTLRFGIKCQLDYLKTHGLRTVDEIYNETYGGNK